jgi:putative ABC transport system permease protein
MFKENLKMAFQAIKANKVRSILSGLGIFIGVFSIILILTIMDGFKYYVYQQFSAFGGSTVYVNKMPFIITSFEDFLKFNRRAPIDSKVLRVLEEEASVPDFIAPVYRSRQAVKFGNELSTNTLSVASTEMHPFVEDFDVEQGRFYTASEVKSRAMVCVVGWDVVNLFFPFGNALGQRITVGGQKYTIIGILKKRGSVFGNSQDDCVYYPLSTQKNLFFTNRGLTIAVKCKDAADLEIMKDELRGILRKVRKVPTTEEDDFALNEANTFTTFFDTITKTLYMTVFGISLICLIVGGVGIMNIMVVSVTERTKEIGIRKALGAKRTSILSQFLSEAVTLSLLGGIPGVIVGFLAAFIGMGAFDFEVPFTMKPILIGFSFSALVGIVSGFFPALKASKMTPVKALSYE